MNNIKKWSMLTIVAVVLLGGGYYGYTKYKQSNGEALEPEPEMAPIVLEVTQETISSKLTVKGKSVYAEETELYAPLGANVKEWKVKHGQTINKGDVLLTLDTTGLQKEVKSVEAELKKARLDAKLQKLNEQQTADADKASETMGGSGEERKQAFIARESKKETARLNEEAMAMREQELAEKKAETAAAMNKATVRAPVSGVFLLDEASAKSRAMADGQMIGKIVNTEALQFVTTVSEQYIFQIEEGMTVQVAMSGQKDRKTTGTIRSVSKFPKSSANADLSQASQFEVIIALPADSELIGGLSLDGQIETERKENAIVVPTLAITREQDETYVMLNDPNGQYEKRTIKTGLEMDDKTEVLEGLKPGDQVVLP